MQETVIEILVRRDGLSREEAQEEWNNAYEEIQEIIASGGSLSDAEEVLKDFFGLEPDYIMEFI